MELMVKKKTAAQLDLEIATFLATPLTYTTVAQRSGGSEGAVLGFAELNKAISQVGPTPILARIDQPDRVNADAQAAIKELRHWLVSGGFQPTWDRYPRGTARYRRKFGHVGGPRKTSQAATSSASKGKRT